MVSAYIRWVTGRATGVLIAFGLVTAGFVTQLASLRVEIDPDSQLPQGHPYVQALNQLNAVFGEKNLVFIGLFPTEGDIYQPGFLAKLSDVTAAIGALPGVVPRTYSSLALPRSVDIRGSRDGMEIAPFLDPLPETREEALAVRERLERSPQLLGILAARDGRAAAIIADFEFTPAIPDYRAIHRAIEAALEGERDDSFRVHLGGPAIYLAWLAHYSARMVWFFPLALLVIGLVHYEAFRTPQAVVLPLVTALLAMVWSLGMLGLLGVPLDPFNVMTPILILAVAAGHAVQLLKRFYEERPDEIGSREAVIRSLGRVGPVMLVAGLIAALSFLSLLTFHTASIRNFGLLTALGIVSALIVEMTFIPAVRALLPPPSARERSRERSRHLFDPVIEAITPFLRRGGWKTVLVVAAVSAAAFGVAASHVEIDSSFRRQFFSGASVRQDDDALNAAFGGTSTLVLLVEGEHEGSIDEPEVLRAIDALQRWLEEQPGVGKTLSFVDYVARMHAAMHADEPPARLPDSRNLVAQYLLLYSFSSSIEDFDNFVDPAHRIAAVRAFLKDDSTRAANALIARLEERIDALVPPGYRVRISGSLASTHALNEVMVHGKLRNIVQIAAIILLVSGLVLRSAVGGLLVATPLAFAVVMTFGVMGLLGVPLDVGTSTISAMAVGIGADYAIYLLFRLREELRPGVPLFEALDVTIRTSGKAILFVSSAIAAGYLVLCLSGFGYHMALGGLVAFAMLVSSLASLTVLPSLIVAFEPRFLRGPDVETTAPARVAGARRG